MASFIIACCEYKLISEKSEIFNKIYHLHNFVTKKRATNKHFCSSCLFL